MDFSEGSERGRQSPRPVSRRGYREYTNSGSGISRSGTMRPSSAYRGSTARVSTAGFGPAPPTASRHPTAMTGFSMIDRPITQQGLSGLRTGTARGFRTRQLQDKRYWEELMQVKVREMKAEIARLSEKADAGERERSAKKHYEKRVRELAQELTDLQGRLADYNTAIRIVNGEATKAGVVEQTRDLEAANQKLQEEVEQVFIEKQRKDNQLRQLREQMDTEQTTISKLLTEMTKEQKEQYNELELTAAALREEAEQARSQVDHLKREKEEFSKEISTSQIKMNLLELHRRLLAVEEKRDKMKNEMNNRLDPQEEREKLLLQGSERGRQSPRPVSRRGYREYTNSGSGISRSGTMRPSSAYRGSTARVSTAGFGPAPPTASRHPTAMTGFSMIDRPITQQGLSGLRTGTARGFRTRQLQDKRYWEELMQVKVREMKAEIARLSEKADAGERERSAKKHYEKRVRELAQELTDLQGRLADYNTAIRIVNGEATKAGVVEQTRDLEAANQKLQEEVEQVFIEKQRKDNQLRQLREQMDTEQTTISKLLTEMTKEQKEQYNELELTAAALREEAEQARSQVDHLKREKEEFSKEISTSQIKMNLLELHRRLLAVEEKRDKMKNEMNNRLDPQEEREKLLLQVREDNAAISSLDSNAASLKEQIKRVQELIEQAEQDLEEGNSERHQKYRELKKREETIDAFMATYDENLKKEQERIENLEKDIVFALEHSSSNIDLDLSEIDALKQKDGYTTSYDDNKKSVDTLMKDYERFQGNLKKAEATRLRLATELKALPEKTIIMNEELVTLSDLEKLRDEGEMQKKELETELNQLKEKLAPTESAVVEATSKLKKLQASLDGNEMYAKLNSLEEQLAQLESRKTVLEEDIASITLKADYEPLKKQALEELEALNKKIIEDLISVKSY